MDRKILLIFAFIAAIISMNKVSYAYVPNETLTIRAIIYDYKGTPITNANCSAYVYKPDGSLAYVLNMSYEPVSKSYYSTFKVDDCGIWFEYVRCNFTMFGINTYRESRKTFYVTCAFNDLNRQIEELVNNATLNVTVSITGNITQAIENTTEDLIGLLFALHSTPITNSTCLDNSTLLVQKVATWKVNNKVYHITKNETMFCEYGCYNGECLPPPTNRYIMYGGVALIIIVVSIILVLA